MPPLNPMNRRNPMDTVLLLLKEIAFLTGVFWLSAPVVRAKPRQQPMTVCELMQHINALDGHIVSVRGPLVLHGSDVDDASPDYMVAQCPALKSKRVEIKIEYPDTWFLRKPPRGYRADRDSFLRAGKVIKATLKDGKITDRWIATIVGQANSVAPAPPFPPTMRVTLEDRGDAQIVIEGIYDLRIYPPERTSK